MFALQFTGPNDCKAPATAGVFRTQAAAQLRQDKMIADWTAAGAVQLPVATINDTSQ